MHILVYLSCDVHELSYQNAAYSFIHVFLKYLVILVILPNVTCVLFCAMLQQFINNLVNIMSTCIVIKTKYWFGWGPKSCIYRFIFMCEMTLT